MTTQVHVPPTAEAVENVRQFINSRFQPVRGQTLNVARLMAHAALDGILEGRPRSARRSLDALDEDGARELRACLERNNLAVP